MHPIKANKIDMQIMFTQRSLRVGATPITYNKLINIKYQLRSHLNTITFDSSSSPRSLTAESFAAEIIQIEI